MTDSQNASSNKTDIIGAAPQMVHNQGPASYIFLGVRMDIHLSGEQTGGLFSLVEVFMPPGGDGGLHVHHREDESIHLISGELEVAIGEEHFTLKPGGTYFAPRGIPHRLENKGTVEVRAFLINTPGTFDPFIKVVGIPLSEAHKIPQGPPSPEIIQQIIAISTQFGVEMLVPPEF